MADTTTPDHYVVCSKCGPIIGKKVDWEYVRKGGFCLFCGGTLKEVKKEK